MSLLSVRDLSVVYQAKGADPVFAVTNVSFDLEQGEFVGRRLAYQQCEAGISARQIVAWLSKKPSPGAAGPKPSPIDLSKFYFKGFYDRGRVSNSASLAELLAFTHAAKGYGFAMEMQSLAAGGKSINLTIGYGRSPDSVLHHSGLAITSVSVNF